ncbi:hypothetical protein DFQ30_002294 [Apophysomyces sp. BC1015]|nr:hypothetical protein DFQ30_002294 [Apophysomyces sp. BC1015]
MPFPPMNERRRTPSFSDELLNIFEAKLRNIDLLNKVNTGDWKLFYTVNAFQKDDSIVPMTTAETAKLEPKPLIDDVLTTFLHSEDPFPSHTEIDKTFAHKTQTTTNYVCNENTFLPSPPLSLSEANIARHQKKKFFHKSSVYVREKIFRMKPTNKGNLLRSELPSLVTSTSSTTSPHDSTTSDVPTSHKYPQQYTVKPRCPSAARPSNRTSFPDQAKSLKLENIQYKRQSEPVGHQSLKRRSLFHVVLGLK